MEVAALVVQLIQALAWPVVIVGAIVWFRRELRTLVGRVLQSPEIEIEYKGVKLKLRTLETLAAKERATGQSDLPAPKSRDMIPGPENGSVFFLAATLSPAELSLLRDISRENARAGEYFYASPTNASTISKLERLGMVVTGQHSDGLWAKLTAASEEIVRAMPSNEA